MTDVCIIGAGPAGVSAALYALRAGLGVTVLDSGSGALRKADKIENYYGLSTVISGLELMSNGIAQAKSLGAVFVEDEAVSLVPAEKGFLTVTAGNEEIESRALIFATGSPRRVPKIPGLTAFEGHGVSYCAVCDAFFYRGKTVAILGFGEYAKAEANHLLPLTKAVTLLTNGEAPAADFPPEVRVITSKIKELFGEKRLEGIRFMDDNKLEIDGVFVAYGAAGGGDLAKKIGALTQGTEILADSNGATNIPGLFAAGDCLGGTLQIAKAVYDGMKAGLSAIKYLRQ